jgi:adenylyltransferase/sulfurtransferase
MNDEQLLRYSRQIMLPEIDAAGQQRLADGHALVIGLGGLGSAASIYLAAGGVGKLTLVDFDRVDLSNLQRQILHRTADIGRPKTESAREHLSALNPEVSLTLVGRAMDEDNLAEYVAGADVVVDASDNFRTRFAVNGACVRARRPLVSAAAIRFEAQITVFDARKPESPCYRCLYGAGAEVDETCTANGVIAPLLGIAGSVQALEAMKILMNVGTTLAGRLLLLDVLTMEWHSARLPKDPHCPVCGTISDTRSTGR